MVLVPILGIFLVALVFIFLIPLFYFTHRTFAIILVHTYLLVYLVAYVRTQNYLKVLIMLIEIFQENSQKCVKSVKDNNFYYQVAYLHLESTKFPVEFQLSLGSNDPAYIPGKYTLSDSSFRVNQYGSLELNRFAMQLIPLVTQSLAPKKTA